eukprot:938849-Rhodomonas_salina.1
MRAINAASCARFQGRFAAAGVELPVSGWVGPDFGYLGGELGGELLGGTGVDGVGEDVEVHDDAGRTLRQGGRERGREGERGRGRGKGNRE